jgi:hypothetical protein
MNEGSVLNVSGPACSLSEGSMMPMLTCRKVN